MDQHPVVRVREIAHGLGQLAEEVEDQLETRPVNLLWWQQELHAVIAELEEGRWVPTAGTPHGRGPAG